MQQDFSLNCAQAPRRLWLRSLICGFGVAALTACAEQPADPTAQPLFTSGQLNMNANRVEPDYSAQAMYFVPGSDEILPEHAYAVDKTKGLVIPQSAQHVWIFSPKNDALREKRVLKLTRWVRSMGFPSNIIYAEKDEALDRNQYRVEFHGQRVVTPNCPDWSDNSVNNYRNRMASHFGCATVSNIGRMIENPADLARGYGNARPDAQRSGAVMQLYKSNAAMLEGDSGASASTGASTGQ